MKRLTAIILVLFGLFLGTAHADGLYPSVPKAVGNPHPEGSAYMRINHMYLLRHDRDDTMRNGNREIKYSIRECVACHAVQGPEGLPISVREDGHFCRACHEYAAVKIDCFQCHNSKPTEGFTELLMREPKPTAEEVSAYLKEVRE
jgi:hypothetical protein